MGKQVLILKIGAPCSGKGALGKAIAHLHGNTTRVLTMRDLIQGEKDRNPEFKDIAEKLQAARRLIPIKNIREILIRAQLTSRNSEVLFLDGAPREESQVSVIKHIFCRREIHVYESVATDEHLLKVFLQTLNADDRANRSDAKVEIHHEGVRIYRQHLPDISKKCRSFNWFIHRTNASATLKAKVRKFEDITHRKGVKGSAFENLELILGLPKLDLHPA